MARLLALLFALQVCGADVVELIIKETAGVARTAEDVTMGVPLPRNGGYTDVNRFNLKDASGNVLPCEFKVLSKWCKDTTAIRWVQLNFPFTVAASDSPKVYLTYESSPYTLASNLTVADRTTYYEVNTGKIRFYVKKANFNVIDQAWVDESGSQNYSAANQVISAHSRGLVYYQADVEYLSSNDAASTVSIERQGAGVVTLVARGALKNSGGSAPLHFVCRVYAFNNSPTVRVSQSVENWDSPSVTTNYAPFQAFHAEIPLTLGATRTAVVGKPAGFETAVLSGASDLYCLARRPAGSQYSMGTNIEGVIGGAATGTFAPKTLKPRDIGWAALSDGSRGCLAAMKYFWQMVPTSAEAFGDGRLLLGLFSKRPAMPAHLFYAGAARTWETQYTFFNALTPDQLRSKAVGATDRLFALASSGYYSRGAMAAYPMMEAGKQSFYTDSNWTVVSQWETKLTNIWSQVLVSDNYLHGNDSYGFLEWGDNPHYDANSWIPTMPWRYLWNGNYYGLPFFAFEHFFHNRDLRFLNYAIAHSRHVQDVQLVHFGPSDANTGGSRYSPPAYHFSVDDDPTTVAGTFTIWNPSHHMCENLFLDYYLTGNDYALEVGLQAADWFTDQGTQYAAPSEHTSTYVRRWAHQMYSQVAAYEHTRDVKYYNNMYQNWEAWKEDIRDSIVLGQPFMVGLAMEAVVKLYGILSPTYHTTGGLDIPDSIPYFLKMWGDRAARIPPGTSSTQINANVTLGYAFLSSFYGRYYQRLAQARANTLPVPPGNLHKDFAQQARNLEMAMYYMAIPESLAIAIKVEKGDRKGPQGGVSLSVEPSPFNPAARILVAGNRIWKGMPVDISIFSPDGRLVGSWSELSRGITHAVEWNAAGMASGVYLVRCRVAGLTAMTRAVLVR